jgi:hypothetical protein
MKFFTLYLFAFAFVLPVFLLAQGTPPVVAPKYDLVTLASTLIAALNIVAIPFLTGLAKKYGPTMPKVAVNAIAAVLGVGIQWLLTAVPGGGQWAPVVGLIYAAIATYLQNIVANLGADAPASRKMVM